MKKENSINITKADKTALLTLKLLIESKPAGAYNIKQLVMQVGINRNKLVYGFKKVTGESIHQFVIGQRMKAAQQLLTTTDFPIKKIAALSGYPNTANFITAFKKFTGNTPLAFQRSI